MPTPQQFIRQDQARINVVINGVSRFDDWYSAEGGNLEVDGSRTRAGGMGDEFALGGQASRTDMEIATQYTDVVANAHPTIETQVGWAEVVVTITPLTGQGSSRSGVQVRTYRGILVGASAPDVDTSSSDASMYTITVACHEVATS